MIVQQKTHWYRPEHSGGWTANPFFAAAGEVEKRGLHDCGFQECQEKHSGSAEDFLTNEIRSAHVASKASGY